MLEYPPIATEQEELDAVKLAFTSEVQNINAQYPYWDKVKYIQTKNTVDDRLLWFALKFLRKLNRTIVSFGKYKFSFMMTDEMFELLHYFDMNIGGSLTGEHLIPSEKRNVYLISSIMEEAIASSKIEGASTTHKVAKDMLRKRKKTKNKGQQMILNNYLTINHIKELAKTDFSISQLLEIHRSMTENTLEDETDAGKIREHDNIV